MLRSAKIHDDSQGKQTPKEAVSHLPQDDGKVSIFFTLQF
jgi:hypothetical protein